MAEKPAGERTEEATPRRLAEARRRGEIANSRDLSSAAVLAAVFGVLAMGAAAAVGRLVVYLATTAESAAAAGVGAAEAALARGLEEAGRALALPLGAAAATALVVGLFQTGALVSGEALRLDPQRAMPRLERVISLRALADVGKGLLKIIVVAALAWVTLAPLIADLVALVGKPVRGVLTALAVVGETLGFRLVLAAAAFGVADYFWQRHRHRRDLRMTREEVKREHKESEGDPQHKGERQRLHQELLEQRMLADVRKADFVVVNPDHIAVALRYDRDGEAAPVVVAKGERLLAERIKEVAREAGVPIFRDVGLARSLRDVQEGDEIPEALYEAVAEILRVVYGTSPEPARRPKGPATTEGQGQEASAAGRAPDAARDPAADPVLDLPPSATWRRA